MMMTLGESEKYKGSLDCILKVIKQEKPNALIKGAGANVVRSFAGAGVLVGFDRFSQIYFGVKLDVNGA